MGEPVKPEKLHTEIYYAKIDQVVVLLLSTDQYLKSKANSQFIEAVKDELGCQDRQAKQYISEAKKEIRNILKLKKEKAFNKVVQDLELIRRRNKDGENDKLFLETVKYYAKMNGLEIDETKGEMTVKNVDMSKMTEYGLERLKRGDKIEDVLMDSKAIKAEGTK